MISLVILILVLVYFSQRKPTPVHRETPAQRLNNRECDDLEDELHDIDGTL
jgi:hypothetical protein